MGGACQAAPPAVGGLRRTGALKLRDLCGETRGPLLIVATFAAGAACSSLDPPKVGNPAPDITTERQILVMLKESPVRHYRPGSLPQPSYGSGPAPMSQLRIAQQLAREYGFQLVSDWAMPSLGVRCFLGEVPAGTSPERDVASRLAADSRVESAQPVQVFRSWDTTMPTTSCRPAQRYSSSTNFISLRRVSM